MTLFDLVSNLSKQTTIDFKKAAEDIKKFVGGLSDDDFIYTVSVIGIIPESIEHDSSEEKLYSKASDVVLAECFNRLGLSSRVLLERGDSADIIAQSRSGYNYSLVADAKCFRLSRTAKNQKDFKISNLSSWRGDENEYAVLVAPYFQYPKSNSQIYSKALENNVCLLSWEHILVLLKCKVKETENFNLESLWNASSMIARNTTVSMSSKSTLLPKMDTYVSKKAGINAEEFNGILSECRNDIIRRGQIGIQYWNREIEKIRAYSREQAIEELIKSKKLEHKIDTIGKYIQKLQKGVKNGKG